MSRLMSVALTTDAVRERRKTATRRLGWWEDKHGRRILKPGDKLTLCPKVQGRRRGDVVEPLDRIVEVTVTSVSRERLDAITPAEVAREGWKVDEIEGVGASVVDLFVAFFCTHMRCTPDTIVTRIEWTYPTPTPNELGRMMDRLEGTPDRHRPHVWQVTPIMWRDLVAQFGRSHLWSMTEQASYPTTLYGLPVVFDDDAPGGIQLVRADKAPRPTASDQHAAAGLPYLGETR